MIEVKDMGEFFKRLKVVGEDSTPERSKMVDEIYKKLTKQFADIVVNRAISECMIASIDELVTVYRTGEVVIKPNPSKRFTTTKEYFQLSSLDDMVLPLKYKDQWDNKAEKHEFDERWQTCLEYIEWRVKDFFEVEEKVI